MEITKALQMVQRLADGVDPLTGELFPEDSPYQQAETVRALNLAVRGLEAMEARNRRKQRLPLNAGKPWNQNEDQDVVTMFREGQTPKEIAQQKQRTEGAILARLVKLGELSEEAVQERVPVQV